MKQISNLHIHTYIHALTIKKYEIKLPFTITTKDKVFWNKIYNNKWKLKKKEAKKEKKITIWLKLRMSLGS